MTVPTEEPLELRVGDTWAWRREDLTVYPAPTWTLKYRFKNATTGFEVVAAADGVNHAVSVAFGTTEAYAAGTYDWQAWVENGTSKYTVRVGRAVLLPNLRAGTAGAAQDTRSHARKVLDAIRAVLENRATVDQEQYQIQGRSLTRTPIADLIKLRNLYEAEVKREDAAANGALDGVDPGRYYVRMNRG